MAGTDAHRMWPYSFLMLTEIVFLRFQRTHSQCAIVVIFGLKRADCIDKGFATVPRNLPVEINVLTFNGNILSKLEMDEFRHYHSLQEIYLVRNRINIVAPDAFRGLHNLQILDIQVNKLNSVPTGSFQHLLSLRILVMKANPIRYLTPDCFKGLVNIEVLNFENCQLQRIHPLAFRGLYKLNEINLVHNELHGLNDATAEFLPPSLTIIRLHMNPWNCDCRLRWLRLWLSSDTINWDFARNSPVCSEPKLLSDIPWRHLSWERFACPSVIVNTVTSIRVQLGTNATLDCIVLGDPEPVITWTRNAVSLSKSAISLNYESNELGDKQFRSSIFIRNATNRDFGDYKCSAVNSAGRSEVTYKVWMEEEEAFPHLGNFTAGVIKRADVIVLGASVGTLLFLALVAVTMALVIRKRQARNQTYKIHSIAPGEKDTNDRQKLRTDERENSTGQSAENTLLAEACSTRLLESRGDDCDASVTPLHYRSQADKDNNFRCERMDTYQPEETDTTPRCLHKIFGRLKERKSRELLPSSPIDVWFIKTEGGGRCEFTPDILRCELALPSTAHESDCLSTIPEDNDNDVDDDVSCNFIDYVNSGVTNDDGAVDSHGGPTTHSINAGKDDATLGLRNHGDVTKHAPRLLTSLVVHDAPLLENFVAMGTVSSATVSTETIIDDYELSDEDQSPLKCDIASTAGSFCPTTSWGPFQRTDAIIGVKAGFRYTVIEAERDATTNLSDPNDRKSNLGSSFPSKIIDLRAPASDEGGFHSNDKGNKATAFHFVDSRDADTSNDGRERSRDRKKSRDSEVRVVTGDKGSEGAQSGTSEEHVDGVNRDHNGDRKRVGGQENHGGADGDRKGIERNISLLDFVRKPKPGQRDSFGTTV